MNFHNPTKPKLKKKSEGGKPLTDNELLDLLGSEYGLTPNEARKLSRREISSLIDGLVSRKSGYQNSSDAVNIKPTDDILKKIEAQNKKLFGDVNDGSRK